MIKMTECSNCGTLLLYGEDFISEENECEECEECYDSTQEDTPVEKD